MTTHLTDEQFDDLLIGDRNAEVSAHLASCALCRVHAEEQRSELGVSVDAFNKLSFAWSERRSATLPVIGVNEPAAPPPMGKGAWATAAVAFAVVAAVGSSWTQYSQALAAHAPRTSASNSAQEIADDNRMLLAIDGELQVSIPSPMESQSGTDSAHARTPQTAVRN